MFLDSVILTLLLLCLLLSFFQSQVIRYYELLDSMGWSEFLDKLSNYQFSRND